MKLLPDTYDHTLTLDNIKSCNVHNDCVMNTSDHVPISMILDIKLPRLYNVNASRVPRPAWNKLSRDEIIQCYTTPLEGVLGPLYIKYLQSIGTCNELSTEVLLEQIVRHMIETSNTHIIKTKYRHNVKPYWSNLLSKLNKAKNSAWHQWIAQGKPRKSDNQYWLKYKEAKRVFRAKQRNSEHMYMTNCIDELSSAHQVDNNYFWFLVNKRKKRSSHIHATRDEGTGEVVYDPGEVQNSWYKYFNQLYRHTNRAHYDDSHRQSVAEEVSRLVSSGDDDDTSVVFSVEEVTDICRRLSKNKAPGWDQLSPEHLIYGSDTMFKLLSIVYNNVSMNKKVPSHFKKAVIVPIPKCKDKDALSKDNYRGISLLSVLSKVYEKLLLKWYDHHCPPNINMAQGACMLGSSCLNVSLALKEGVAGLRSGGNSAYVCLLDARKAFDTVWYEGLFLKLFRMGCNKHLWSILWSYYQGFMCSVQVAGGRSEWFIAEQGVHQGGPFSMKLYVVFNADLLDELMASGHGARVCGSNLSCVAYADDIALMALYKPKLQALLDIAYVHSCKCRYEFNPSKSHVIIYGRDMGPDMSLRLGSHELEVVGSDKHLGIPLSPSKSTLDTYICGLVSKGRRCFYASLSLGNRFNPVPPLILSRLYWSIVIPSMTYGLELVNLSHGAEWALEAAHLSMARVIQGLPTQTSRPAILAPLGWWSIHALLAYRRMVLLWRVLLLPSSSFSKIVLVFRICEFVKSGTLGDHYGPVMLCIASLKEYGLLSYVLNCVRTGILCSISEWKMRVRIRVCTIEYNKHITMKNMYKKLNIYNLCTLNFVWPWWVFAGQYPKYTRKCKTILRILVGEHCLASNPGSQKYQLNKSKLCQMCNTYAVDDAPHFLFACEASHAKLNQFWDAMTHVAPERLMCEIRGMSATERTKFFLSGFNCKYVNEWSDVYEVICIFICDLYDVRMNTTDS